MKASDLSSKIAELIDSFKFAPTEEKALELVKLYSRAEEILKENLAKLAETEKKVKSQLAIVRKGKRQFEALSPRPRRGRPPLGEKAMTGAERTKRHRDVTKRK